MLEIKNEKVYDLRETVIACRNAMRLDLPEYTEDEFVLGLNRAKQLVQCGGGTGHSSFRKGIRVNFDMKYTQYITKQFQRYHWFDYICSTSLMHRITKMDFRMCTNEYTTTKNIELEQSYVELYNKIIKQNVECYHFTDLKVPKYTTTFEDTKYVAFMQVISNCPMGAELFVRVTTNYEELATICKQRKHHKLREDWQAFIKFVQGLPYSDILMPEAYEK